MKKSIRSSSALSRARVYLLYARVSPKGSSWSAGETSISVQLQECREYVLHRDPAAEFIEVYDEMKSGKNLERPGVQRVISDLQNGTGGWDCLVVWHLDRLTRSLSDALPLFKMIRDADRGFMAVRQEIDMFTAGGRFMLHIFISTAEYEREMTSERVSAKMHGIAAQGKIPWGNIPFGYRRAADKKNTLEIVPEDAQIVREIFALFLSGCMSFTEIRRRYGDRFKYRTHIYKILRTRMYIGEFEYDGQIYQAEHEPIVDRETFDRAQQLLPEKGGYHRPRPGAQKYKYLLAGMVRCKCGHTMTTYSATSRGKRFFYYKCTDQLCKNAVSAPSLDDAVMVQVKKVVRDRAMLQKLFEEYERKSAEERLAKKPEVAALDRSIEEAKKKERSVASVFSSGMVKPENMDFWNDELKRVRDNLAALEKRRSEFVADLPVQPPDGFFEEFLEKMQTWATSLDVAGDDYALKRTMIGSIVDTVECIKKNQFRVKLVLSKCIGWWA